MENGASRAFKTGSGNPEDGENINADRDEAAEGSCGLMPRLIERIRNVFDDHLTDAAHSAASTSEAAAFRTVAQAEILARSNDLRAALLKLKRQSDTGINEVFARLHDLTFSPLPTSAPDEFRQAVQFILDSAELRPVAAWSEQPGARGLEAIDRSSGDEQLPPSLRLLL